LIIFFSETSAPSRPYVIDFKTGVHAAVLALTHGWKDGYTDLVSTPRIAYERHGKLGGIAGTFIGLANSILKPVTGTLASLTWFCRGIYANVNNESLIDKGTESCTINTLGLDNSSSIPDFSSEVCQQIISEFDQIKKQNISYRYKSK
jgi:hypothetical protein